jgi:hypothetical protein
MLDHVDSMFELVVDEFYEQWHINLHADRNGRKLSAEKIICLMFFNHCHRYLLHFHMF